MNDLRSYAQILIYPDGIVEKIFAEKGKTEHLYYFHKQLRKSKKFANIIYHSSYKIDFKDWIVLDRALAEAGLVVIRNLEILYLSQDISYIHSKEPFAYLINLPSNIRENNAYLPMQCILRENQGEEYTFGIYSLETKEFEEINYNFLEEKLENEERRF